jgi:hypothetical protein
LGESFNKVDFPIGLVNILLGDDTIEVGEKLIKS